MPSLPRHERVDPKQRPAFRLTLRDCNIIKAVNDCQALQLQHVQTLFFKSTPRTYERLKLLYHHEYLDRHFITQVVTAPAASPTVYTISKLGAEVLATMFGYDNGEFNFAGRAVTNWKTLQHILAVNDVRVALMKASEQDGYEWVQWVDENKFRANPDTVYIATGRGRPQKKLVIPDGYLILKTPRGEARFFIEADRGTEGSAQFRTQVEIYQEYIKSNQYRERFQTTAVRVLVVTKSQRRLGTIKKTIAQAGGGSWYWLTTFDQLTPETVLTEPIWHKMDSDKLHALVY